MSEEFKSIVKQKIEVLEEKGIWFYNENLEKYINEGVEFFKKKEGDSYGKDSRSHEEMLANVLVNGWLIEDSFIKEMESHNSIVELAGSDKCRTFKSGGGYTAYPDFKINGRLYELQNVFYGVMRLKQNKVKNNIKNDSNLILKLLDNKYILLDTESLKKIYEKDTVEIYCNKQGWRINVEKDIESYTMEDLVCKINEKDNK